MADRLDLIVPGLFGPLPERPDGPRTPTLDLLCARAQPEGETWREVSEPLLARFGATCSAPYTLAADDPDWDRAGWWMHAAPVHLRPDRDLLRLYDARHLGISRAEADALIAELNRTFGGDGLSFHAPVAGRWYLRSDRPLDMQTTPIGAVVGGHIDGALPSGPDARRWAALMSEMQMLLFQAEPNRRREAEGRPAVNGLWCWGGGSWQALAGESRLGVGADPLLAGLCAAAACEVRNDPGQDVAEILPTKNGNILVLWDALESALLDRAPTAWNAAVAALERWAAPLPAALRSGALRELWLHPCGGEPSLILRPPALRWYRGRFWRRPEPLAERATAQIDALLPTRLAPEDVPAP